MFHAYLCYAVLSIASTRVITCWERAAPLALLCVVFSCIIVTFPYGVQGHRVLALIVSIPDFCVPLCCNSRNFNFIYSAITS